ncbi:MAG TPA: ABC transporter permease [Myxococcales bacterium]|nr:ABC transporter permease [Myxococcales bacterium]
MDGLLRDLRFGLRGLRQAPGFAAAAVLALALGIGATTAIFSVVHAVLLRSLGWGDETRLVSITTRFEGLGITHSTLSVPELFDLREAPFLESFAGYNDSTAALQGSDRAERVRVAVVTSGFFDVLGAQPTYGRAFTAEEDSKGNDGVALVSAPAFRSRFGGDPAAVGRTVTLDGRSYRIVGILPGGFSYGGPHDFFIPFGFTQEQLLLQRGAHYVDAVAKLRPGVAVEAASRQIAALGARVRDAHREDYPGEKGFGLELEPLRERFVGGSRQAIAVLFGAVLLVLLIACGNVANLLLARAAARERELAVRAALGADRARIVRQLLTEGLLLAAAGAALGVLLAAWGLDVLLAAAPRQIRELAQVRLDPAVLAFSAALTVATTLIFALVPALRASRLDLSSSLKDGGRGTAGVPAARLRAALVVAQVATCLFLLAGAGLMLRSFSRLLQVAPGFDPEGAVTADLNLAGPAYDDSDEARERYFEEALRAAAALPGATAAGGINVMPTRGSYRLSYSIEGYEPRPGEAGPSDQIRRVLPGYFAAMRQRVAVGRDFSPADDAKAPRVALVNEAWVRRYFPGRDVLGKRIRLDSKRSGEWRTIVGVVGDVRERGLDFPAPPVYYFAAAQMAPEQMTLVVRGAVRPAALQETLSRIDPAQPVDRVAPLGDLLAASVAPRRFPLQLLSVFAAVALLLSAVGIYGVTSYAVAQRTREIGVRMAIGASALDVLRMVLGGALRTVGLGLGMGLLGALAGSRLIASQLYGVSARDPATFLVIATVLALVGLLASAIPAIRAAHVDPMAALRSE